jgi:hypothetical protein
VTRSAFQYNADERATVLEIYLAGYGPPFVNGHILREAVKALRRDEQRIDWLESKDRVHIEPAFEAGVDCSLRDAIDAAMAKEAAGA